MGSVAGVIPVTTVLTRTERDHSFVEIVVGESVEGQAGDMNMRIESSKGTGFDGGSVRLASGQAEGKGGNGGSVFISSGDAASSAEINVDWERRVQFEALRDGNALKQNDVLQRAIQRDA